MNGGYRIPKHAIGATNALTFALMFAKWAAKYKHGVTPRMVMEKWGVSRATGYRWANAWREVA